MKPIIIYILLLFGVSAHAQSTWFEFVPGNSAMQTHVLGDTLVSFGTGVGPKRYFIPINYTNGVTGKLLYTDTLDYFQLSGDSFASLLYGNANQSIYDKKNKQFKIGLSYKDSMNGKLDWHAALFNTSPFEKTVELSQPNYRSLVIYYDQIGAYSYVIMRWLTVSDNGGIAGSNKIYRINSNGDIKVIKHVILQKICASCHSLKFDKILPDNQSSESLFLLLTDQWDFRGGADSYQGEIIKMDTNGQTLWKCRPNVNDSFNTTGFQCVQKPDGNLICFWSDRYYRPHKNPRNVPYQTNYDSASLWCAEVDYTTGKVLWLKSFRDLLRKKLKHQYTTGIHIVYPSGIKVLDEKLYIYGHYQMLNRFPFLLKTDLACNPIWYREFYVKPDTLIEDGDYGMEVNHCVVSSDNGFVLSGDYLHYNGVRDNFVLQTGALLKLDSLGCLEPGCQKYDDTASKPNPPDPEPTILTQSKVYPNPANDELIIELPGRFPADWKVTLLDAMGRVIGEFEVEKQKVSLNVNSFSPGIYIIQLKQFNAHQHEIYKISIQP